MTFFLLKNCTELIFVLRLLSLSLLSWELIDTQANKEPKIVSLKRNIRFFDSIVRIKKVYEGCESYHRIST